MESWRQLSYIHLQLFSLSLSVSLPSFLPLSGVPGVQRVGPVCHQVHAKRDIWSASVPTEITALCPGGCGGAEQPCTVSTAPTCTWWHYTVATVIHRNAFTGRHIHTRGVWMDFPFQPTDELVFPHPCALFLPHQCFLTVIVCTFPILCWWVEVFVKSNVREVSVEI